MGLVVSLSVKMTDVSGPQNVSLKVKAFLSATVFILERNRGRL